jgi:N-acetylmuramoyl-L-alanine amidase
MKNEIVLDPGHGGIQQLGKSSPDGVRFGAGQLEKQVNFVLAQRVSEHLGGAQFTRREQENRSLRDRIAVARSSGARAFVSLHTNPQSGGNIWVHPRAGSASVRLAEAICRQLAPVYGGAVRVSRGELAVLDPGQHHRGTAACMVDLGVPDARKLDGAAAAIARALQSGTERWGAGLPNLSFGPLGPNAQPFGAVNWNSTPVQDTPGLITWREFNQGDVDAQSYTTRITVLDDSGRVVFGQEQRRDGLAAGAQVDGSVTFTPPSAGRFTARVRVNDGVFPIPEESVDDDVSEASATAFARSGAGAGPVLDPSQAVPMASYGYRSAITDALDAGSADTSPAIDPALADSIESELRTMLEPERLINLMLDSAADLSFPEPLVADGTADGAAPEGNYAGGYAYGQVPDPTQPPPPRPGTPADLARALLLFPPINQRLRLLGDDAVLKFRSLSGGEQGLLLTWSVPFAAGLITGIVREPRLWPVGQSLLNQSFNAAIHPLVPDLNVNLDLVSPNKSFMITFDLAPTLRRAGLPF